MVGQQDTFEDSRQEAQLALRVWQNAGRLAEQVRLQEVLVGGQSVLPEERQRSSQRVGQRTAEKSPPNTSGEVGQLERSSQLLGRRGHFGEDTQRELGGVGEGISGKNRASPSAKKQCHRPSILMEAAKHVMEEQQEVISALASQHQLLTSEYQEAMAICRDATA